MAKAATAWNLDAADYPASGPLRAQLEFLLRYAILAPSTHNTQPWQFDLRADGIDIYIDDSRRLPVIDPQGRQRVMSCAAALHNLRVAARAFGHKLAIEIMPQAKVMPTWLARVRVVGARRILASDRALRDAIVTRRTNRQPYMAKPVSFVIADELAAIAEKEGAWMLRLHPKAKAPLAEIITAADRAQFADKEFRSELAQWLVPAGSTRRDGIPFAKKEYGNKMPFGVSLLVRTFDLGGNVAAKEAALAEGSPMLIVIGTDGDAPRDWVSAGLAMQALWLAGVTHGLSASYLNQALEVPALRAQVEALIGGRGQPQLVMRMGFGPEVAVATPRRPLKSVVLGG